MSPHRSARAQGRANRLAWRRALGRLAGAAVVLSVVSACGDGFRKDLGLIGEGPDEFTVVPRKPLSLPQNGDLPTPRPGEVSPLDPTPLADAQRALQVEVGATEASAPSSGEAGFVQAAGAAGASDAVRTQLETEAAPDDRRVLDIWLGKDEPGIDPLDQEAEARRLAEQAQRSVNPELEVPPPPPVE